MKKNFKKYLAISLLVIAFSVGSSFMNTNTLTTTNSNSTIKDTINTVVSTLPTHLSVSVTTNASFRSNGFTGNGTSADPYVLNGYSITSTTGVAISISGTNAYFIIRNCYVSTNESGYNGLQIDSAQNGIVENNIITASYEGISSSSSSNMIFRNNLLTNNTYYGMFLASVNLLTVYNNTILYSTYTGLLSFGNSNGTVTYNNISFNDISGSTIDYGITDEAGSVNITYSHNIVDHNYQDGIWIYAYGPQKITYNTVFGNQGNGIYFGYGGAEGYVDVSNNYVANNTLDGLNLDAANNNTITNNVIIYNGGNGVNVGQNNINNYFYNNTVLSNTLSGFLVDGSSANVTVTNNIINKNSDGIYLQSLNGVYASNSTFENNTISRNVNSGITIISNNNDNFTRNFLYENAVWGVYEDNSSDNFYFNSFVNNSYQAPLSLRLYKVQKLMNSAQGVDMTGTSNWDNGHYGNYWSDYTGGDTNHDGIGDFSYSLSGNIDNKPLMYPDVFSLNTVPDLSFNEGTTGHVLTWNITGYENANYVLFQDNVQKTSQNGLMVNGSALVNYNVDSLSTGTYTFKMVVTNLNMSLHIITLTTVTVLDVTAPVLTASTTSITYVAGTTGHSISIKASDLHPSSYIVYENGTQVDSGSWTTNVNITVSVDGLSAGVYNFTIVVSDTSSNTAKVTVMITVLAPNTGSNSTQTESSLSQASSGPNKSSPSFEFVAVMIGLFTVTGFLLRKRKT